MSLVTQLRECSSDEAYLSRAAADEIERLHEKVNSLMTAIYEAGDLLDAGRLTQMESELRFLEGLVKEVGHVED